MLKLNLRHCVNDGWGTMRGKVQLVLGEGDKKRGGVVSFFFVFDYVEYTETQIFIRNSF